MAAINYFSHTKGYTPNINKFHRLYLLLRGIKRTQGKKFTKQKRAPITPAILRNINSNLFNSSKIYEDKIMLWTAILVAFFGFLRISEYTAIYKTKYDPATTLLYEDVTTTNNTASINIKASKTDPFRQGNTIRLAQNNSILCPINALKQYISIHPTKNGPLFKFTNGKHLTRKDINKTLQESIPPDTKNISSHSLRIGAASTAAAIGCPRWLIQNLGRWTSDCFRQ